MVIDYELQGSYARHKGVFETTGFSATFEEQRDQVTAKTSVIAGYKIVGMNGFAYFSEEYQNADEVYQALVEVINGTLRVDVSCGGFIRRIA